MLTDCLFCKIIHGDIPAEKIYEDEFTIVILDIKPTNSGHALVIPKRHAADLLDGNNEDAQRILMTVRKMSPTILSTVGATACNVITNIGPDAGQVIFHTHVHIVPRFPDDGFKHWPGKEVTKEELAELAEKIRSSI